MKRRALPPRSQLEALLQRGGLVLSRKVNEAVLLGDDVAIQVAEIRGDKVRLRFCAPEGLRILRDELLTETDGG